MVPSATLKRFEVEGDGQNFVLHIEDDQGKTLQFAASRDQLDMIADALDDILLHDGSTDDEVDAKG